CMLCDAGLTRNSSVRLTLEDRPKEDGLAASQHVVDGLLHPDAYLPADRPHGCRVVRCLWRIVSCNTQWLQKLGMPLRGQWQREERKRGSNRNARPHTDALPPLPMELRNNGENFRTTDRYEWYDRGAIAQGDLHILIASKLAQPIDIVIVLE